MPSTNKNISSQEAGAAWSVLACADSKPVDDRSPRPKAFPRFSELPNEIQIMIYEQVILTMPKKGQLGLVVPFISYFAPYPLGGQNTWTKTILTRTCDEGEGVWVKISQVEDDFVGIKGLLGACRLSRLTLLEWFVEKLRRWIANFQLGKTESAVQLLSIVCDTLEMMKAPAEDEGRVVEVEMT